MTMWEFLKGKGEKDQDSALPVAEVLPKPQNPEAHLAVEQGAAEQAAEQVKGKYAAILSQASAEEKTEPVIPDIHRDTELVGQVMDTTSQVNQLVELAQVKGLAHAVTVAQRLNDLYVLDMTHDEFVDKWYEALKAKGLVQGE